MKAKLLASIVMMSLWPAHFQAFTPTSPGLQPLAITFDDLPAHGKHPPSVSRLQIIQAFLATMRAEKLPPIYGFINGVRTEEDPTTHEALEAWRNAGQPLGNHTWSHPDFDDTSSDQFIANIEANQPLLRALMPAASDDWHWLRFPYLNEGKTLEKHREVRSWLKDNHYKVAEVTLDWDDWAWNAPYTHGALRSKTAPVSRHYTIHTSALQTSLSVTTGTPPSESTVARFHSFCCCMLALSMRRCSQNSLHYFGNAVSAS